MRKNPVLNHACFLNDNLDDTCFNRAMISGEKTCFYTATLTMGPEAEGNFHPDRNTNSLSLTPQLKVLPAIFRGIAMTIKVSVLIALSFIYTVIALPAVILYLILYNHSIGKLINKIRQEKRKSPYYYKWKNHHLDLNWEA